MGRQILLCRQLRRLGPCSASPSFFHLSKPLQNPGFHSGSRSGGTFSSPSDPSFLSFTSSISFRSFSWHSSTETPENDRESLVESSRTDLELQDMSFDVSQVVNDDISEFAWYSPVRALISLLDGYHDLTILPWWIIIATSTLALRMALLPLITLQLKKLDKMSGLLPKLPPPFPPPFSGRSFLEHFLMFRKERRSIGCPSHLWSFASFLVQVPCFILWMTSIRRMSLDHHPGFDCGGALWFHNLTEFPNGVSGPIFPILIAGLHFINVQISFRGSPLTNFPGFIGLLARYYKLYLDVLTLPILLIGFCVPQGSLIYWVTNSSLNVVQQLSLKHPCIRKQLGLRELPAPVKHKISKENSPADKQLHPLSLKHSYIRQKLGQPANSLQLEFKMSTDDLPPDELLAVALQHLAMGHQDRALPLLRLASEKDPELDRALIAIGLFLLSRGSAVEATQYFERAISKIKDEQVSHLVIASYGAGVSLLSQGRSSEAINHLQRIAQLKEPEDAMDRYCYFSGLVVLGSALFNDGQKAEAVKYLRTAAVYDPSVNRYIEECEREEN